MSHQSFRPSLTSEEIEFLCRILETDLHPQAQAVFSKLNKFRVKLAVGLVQPSHTYKPQATLLEKLEGEDVFPRAIEQQRESLYHAWAVNKSARAWTARELEQIATYRYENNLMTPEEMVEFERQMFEPQTKES